MEISKSKTGVGTHKTQKENKGEREIAKHPKDSLLSMYSRTEVGNDLTIRSRNDEWLRGYGGGRWETGRGGDLRDEKKEGTTNRCWHNILLRNGGVFPEEKRSWQAATSCHSHQYDTHTQPNNISPLSLERVQVAQCKLGSLSRS